MVGLLQGSLLDGRYKVLGKLSDSVLKVEDRNGQMLAAKMIHDDPQHEGLMAHMHNVAKSTANLNHPNIVRLHDIGISHHHAYFITDLVQGPDLSQVLHGKGTLPWAHAKPVFVQICDGLEALHGIGLIHRNLKPSKIMLSEGASGMTVKIIGHLYGRLPDSDFIGKGMYFGTPQYSAPEQISPGKSMDHRVDIFAVGIIMYQTLSGVVPFASRDFIETMIKRLHWQAPKLSEAKSGISRDIEALVKKALELSPERRFQSAAELRESIQSI